MPLLKAVEQFRYFNSDHIAVYRVQEQSDGWVIYGYSAPANTFSTTNPEQLTLAYATEAGPTRCSPP
jgi:hypothetical protein